MVIVEGWFTATEVVASVLVDKINKILGVINQVRFS